MENARSFSRSIAVIALGASLLLPTLTAAQAAVSPYGGRDAGASLDNVYRPAAITVSDVFISERSAKAVTGSFKVVNGEEETVGGLTYRVELLGTEEDADIAYGRTLSKVEFALAPNESKVMEFSSSLPGLPEGDYRVRIQITTTSGRSLGWKDATFMTTKTASSFVKLYAGPMTIAEYGDEKLQPRTGPNVKAGGEIQLTALAVNDGTNAVRVTPILEISPFDAARGIVSTLEFAPVTLQPGEERELSFPVTAKDVPEVYSAMLRLRDTSTKASVSTYAEYRWVVRGIDADIVSTRLIGPATQAGEQAYVKIDYVGAADAETQSTGTITMTLLDGQGVVGETTVKAVSLRHSLETGIGRITLDRNLVGEPSVRTTITSDAGDVLAETTAKFTLSHEQLLQLQKDTGIQPWIEFQGRTRLSVFALLFIILSYIAVSGTLKMRRLQNMAFSRSFVAILLLVSFVTEASVGFAAGNGIEVVTPKTVSESFGADWSSIGSSPVISLFVNSPSHNSTVDKDDVTIEYRTDYAVSENEASNVRVIGRFDRNGGKQTSLVGSNADWESFLDQSYSEKFCAGDGQYCVARRTYSGRLDASAVDGNATTVQLVAKMEQNDSTPSDDLDPSDVSIQNGFAHGVNVWVNFQEETQAQPQAAALMAEPEFAPAMAAAVAPPATGCIDIIKETYNANGQSITPVPFTFKINNQNPIQSGTNGRARYTNLQPGQYMITETVPSGWSQLSVTPSNSIVSVTSGASCATIVFKNKQNQTTPPPAPPATGCIDIIKETYNANGQSITPVPFTFKINNQNPIQSGTNGRARYTNLQPGQYNITETVPSGWQQLSVTPSSGTVSVTSGASCATIVFKNKQNATTPPPPPATGCIDIIKETYNANGQSITPVPFTFKINGQNPIQSGTNGRARYTNLQPGQYNITETVPSGWQQLSVTPSSGTVSVTSGASCATIVFKNKQNQTTPPPPSPATGCIDIIKETYNANGQSITPIAFTFKINNQNPIQSGTNGRARYTNLQPGQYNITETVPSGWSQLSVTPSSGTVNVTSGASCATIVFKNKQNATTPPPPQTGCIDIVKETYDTNGARLTPTAQFTFKLNNQNPLQNDGSGRARYTNLQPGQYQVTESVPSTWQQLSVSPSNGMVTVTAGSTCATVTFKNKQVITTPPPPPPSTGCIDIIKETYNAQGQSITPIAFTFKINGQNPIQSGTNGRARYTNLQAGQYNITEVVPSGWTQLSVTPSNGIVNVTSGASCATIVFKNKQNATTPPPTQTGCIDIKKETYNTNGQLITPVTQFTFKLNNQNPLQNDGSGRARYTNLQPGQYQVTEEVPNTWTQLSVSPSNGLVNVTAGSTCAQVTFKNKQVIQQTPKADVALDKTGPVSVVRGNVISFTLTARNNGPDAAQNVIVTDPIPAGLTYVDGQSDSRCNQSGNNVVCQLGTMNAGQTINFTIAMQTQQSLSCNAALKNVATIASSTEDIDPFNNEGQHDFIVTCAAPQTGCVDIVKETYNAQGQSITPIAFTFKINNQNPIQNGTDGRARYTNLQAGQYMITEEIPAGWTQLSVTPANGIVNVTAGASCATIVFKNKQLPTTPQTGCIDIRKETYDTNGQLITPVAQFTFRLNNQNPLQNDGSGRARYTNLQPGQYQVTEQVPSTWQQLSVSPSNGLVNVTAGNTCAQVTFKNKQVLHQPECVPDPEDDLDGDFNGNGSVCTIRNTSDDCTYDVGVAVYKAFDNDGDISDQVLHDSETAKIGPNQTITLGMDLPMCAYQSDCFYGPVIQSFAGGQRYGDRLLDDHDNFKTGELPFCSNVTPKPDMSIEKSGPATVFRGDNVTYTLVARNLGQTTAQNVVVTDTIPSGMTYIDSQSDNRCNQSGNNVVCQIGSVGVGQSTSISITMQTSSTAVCNSTIRNVATVSTTNDSNSSNNTDSHDVKVECPVPQVGCVDIVKEAYNTTGHLINPTPQFTFLINGQNPLENDGSGRARYTNLQPGQYQITENVPATWQMLSVSPANGIVTVNPGSTCARVTFKNKQVITETDVSVQKTGASSVLRGQTFAYTVTVRNNGSIPAQNVVVTDAVPAGLEYVDASSDSSCNLSGNDVICQLGTLSANQTRSLQIAFRAPEWAECSEITVHNTASVTTSSNDRDLSNNVSSTVTTTVTCPAPKLGCIEVTKKAYDQNGNQMSSPLQDKFTFRLSNGQELTTDNQDKVLFSNLPFGSYSVSEVLNADYDLIDPVSNSAQVFVDSSSACKKVTFKNKKKTTTTDVSVTKSATSQIVRGQNITYTITVRNNGSIPAENVTVNDNLPIGVAYQDLLSDASCNQVNDSSVRCDLGTLNAGATRTVTIVVTVPPIEHCTVVNVYNTASVGTTTTDSNPSNNYSNTASTRVECPPPTHGCIDIVKEAYNAQGQKLSQVPVFTFSLDGGQQTTTNNVSGAARFQPVPIGQHTVSEIVPEGWQLLSTTPSNGIVNVQGGNNCATIIFKNKQQITETDVSIVKTGPSTVIRGNTVTYTLTVRNHGQIPATNVVVTDTFPSNLDFVSANAQGGTCSGTSPVTCSLSTLQAGEQRTITIVGRTLVEIHGCSEETIYNVAHVTTATPDSNAGNNQSSTIATTVTCPTPQVGCIEIVKETYNTNGQLLTPTAQFTFRLDGSGDYRNDSTGRIRINNVSLGNHTVTEEVPATWQQLSVSPANGHVNVQAGNTCAVVTFKNKQVITTTDVTIQKTGAQSVTRGNNVVYTIAVTNLGQIPAQNVVVTDAFPAGFVFEPTGSDSSCELESSGVVCSLGTLAAGQTRSLNVVFHVPTTQACTVNTVTNTATVTTTTNESTLANNQSQATTQILCPTVTTTDVTVQKTGPATIVRGNTLTYSILVTNIGQATAQNVTVTDSVPAGLSYLDAQSDALCNLQGDDVICSVGTLAVGQSRTLQLAFNVPTIAAGTCATTTVYNTAIVSTTTTETNTGNNTSTATTEVTCPVPQVGCIDIKKETYNASNDEVTPVIPFTFRVDGTIQGQNDASGNLRVNNVTPGNHTVTEDILTGWQQLSVTPNNGTVVVPAGGACATVVFKNKQVISNTDVSILKTGASSVLRGQTINYTITVSNLGNIVAQNVIVTDAVPAGLEYLDADSDQTCSQQGNNVVCSLGSLQPGEVNTLTIAFRAPVWAECSAATVTNTAVVSTTTPETSMANNQSFATTQITCPVPQTGCIEVTKEAYDANNNRMASTPTFTFLLNGGAQIKQTNAQGKATFTNVPAGINIVTEDVPANWMQTSITPPAGYLTVTAGTTCAQVTFRNRQIPPPSNNTPPPVNVNVQTQVNPVIQNQFNPSIQNNPMFWWQSSNLVAQRGNDLSVEKWADRSEAQPNDDVHYTVVVHNDSDQDLENLQVVDTFIASQMTILNSGGGDASQGRLAWTIDTLAAGESETFSYTARMSNGLRHGDVVENTVTVRGKSARYLVRIIKHLPQTGESDLLNPIAEERPYSLTSTSSSQDTFPITVLLTLTLMGLSAGGVGLRRMFL